MPAPAIRWTDQADAQLLSAIIETSPPINYAKVAELLGNGLTANAVQHRIRKIRAKGITGSTSPVTPSGTPKAKRTATPKKSNTRKRKHEGGIESWKEEPVAKEKVAKKEIKGEEDDKKQLKVGAAEDSEIEKEEQKGKKEEGKGDASVKLK